MRTHLCGQLDESSIDQEVRLAGWVLNRRDHGGVIFIDLRDRSGRVQVVADPDYPEPFAVADRSRNEFVLEVKGRVRMRPEGTVNEELSTGTIEVLASEINLLSRAEALPFQLCSPTVMASGRAAALVAYRELHGPFASLESLTAVSGIGPGVVRRLRGHVRVR